jgi:putative thioredoxin
LVDFWAEWCAPCRRLGPVLEKLAREYSGKFVLVKANTEHLPDIAAQFGVRSIPAVFAVKDGHVVDQFVGILPESVIREFLNDLIPTPIETLLRTARQQEATDPAAAESSYHEALRLDPESAPAKIGLAGHYLQQGQLDAARSLIADLERRGFLEPEAEAIQAKLTLQAHAAPSGDVTTVRAALATDPQSPQLRLQLAEALAAAGNHAEALELCLDLFEHDRKGTGEAARQTMLAIFQVLPPGSPLASEYQRKLSLAL